MLSPKYVIPVPTPKEAEMAPEIPAHQEVLALYPSTTCFYRAVVISPPSKVRVFVIIRGKTYNNQYNRIRI